MKSYLALMFAKPEDISTYGKEVAAAIKKISGGRMKYAEGGAGVVAIGFATGENWSVISRAFHDLWRPEQRTWVLPLDEASLVDKALLDWAKKQAPESPF